jgi:TrmH family RNA methyltransferase
VPGCVKEVFATSAGLESFAWLLQGREVTLVTEQAMQGLSDSVTPPGVIALCRFLHPREASSVRLVAICADVRDPGNAGTVIRTADAAGADAVVLAGESVDPYNPKTVRATVGSLFHLPVHTERDPLAAVAAAKQGGLTVLAADMNGQDLFASEELLARPTAWLFGNEAWGLPDELKQAADHVVSIPIFGEAESLNLSAAAAVCLYASARAQRL